MGEWTKYQREIDIIIEIRAGSQSSKSKRRREPEPPSSDPIDLLPSPDHKKERRTRITQLRGQLESKQDTYKRMGRHEEGVMDR